MWTKEVPENISLWHNEKRQLVCSYGESHQPFLINVHFVIKETSW